MWSARMFDDIQDGAKQWVGAGRNYNIGLKEKGAWPIRVAVGFKCVPCDGGVILFLLNAKGKRLARCEVHMRRV